MKTFFSSVKEEVLDDLATGHTREVEYQDVAELLNAETPAQLDAFRKRLTAPVFTGHEFERVDFEGGGAPNSSGFYVGLDQDSDTDGDLENLSNLMYYAWTLMDAADNPRLSIEDLSSVGIVVERNPFKSDARVFAQPCCRLRIKLKAEPGTISYLEKGIEKAAKSLLDCKLYLAELPNKTEGAVLELCSWEYAMNVKTYPRRVCADMLNILIQLMVHDISLVYRAENPLNPNQGGLRVTAGTIAASLFLAAIDAYQSRDIRVCPACGKAIFAGLSTTKKPTYCSDACRKRHGRLLTFRENVEERDMSEKDAAKDAEVALSTAKDYWEGSLGRAWLSKQGNESDAYGEDGSRES